MVEGSSRGVWWRDYSSAAPDKSTADRAARFRGRPLTRIAPAEEYDPTPRGPARAPGGGSRRGSARHQRPAREPGGRHDGPQRAPDRFPAGPDPARVPRGGRARAPGARGPAPRRPCDRPGAPARRHAGGRRRRQPAGPRPAEVRGGAQLDDRGARVLEPAPPRRQDEHRRRSRRVLAGGQRHHVRVQAPEGGDVAPRARPRGRRRQVLVRADAGREDRVALAIQLADHRPDRGAGPRHRALRHQAAVRAPALLPGHATLLGHRPARHRREARRSPEGGLGHRPLHARALRCPTTRSC